MARLDRVPFTDSSIYGARAAVASAFIACFAMGFGCSKGSSDDGSRAGSGGAGDGGSSAASGGMNGGASGSGVSACPEDSGAAGDTTGAGGAPEVTTSWDWNGVIGTGQSLAVGQNGPPKSTTQPYNNLKLSTGTAEWPIDPEDPSFELVPLTEPIGRRSTAYPSAYPTNIAGETPHSAMANQITALVANASGGDHVGVHGEYGENGQCMSFLKKGATPSGVNGRAYEATLLETQAIARLAADAGKTYGVGAVIVTHGECDAGNTRYDADLFQLWSDYNTDIAAITGQTQNLLMIVSQQNAVNSRAASTLTQWRAGVEHPEEIVVSGPKYQYPYSSDGIHLVTAGYQQLGEKYGQVYFERVVLGRAWQPLQPTRIERSGSRSISVHFHVPVSPLVWETTFPAPLQGIPEWARGKGFELRGPSGRLTISAAEVCGNSVLLTSDADIPASGVYVGYALTGQTQAMASAAFTGTFRWGLLRDSDPFVGSTTGTPQPNYAVAFELPVP
jgi:hypothetical protein